MELKLVYLNSPLSWAICSNRTFMELKCDPDGYEGMAFWF